MTVHGAAVPGEEMFACICGKRLNPRQGPPVPQPEQVQEHGASAMPEGEIVLSEFRPRSMSWQPQMSMLCFSRARIAAASWKPAKMACASVQRVMVWVSVLALLTTASGCPVFGGRGADTAVVRHSAIRSFHPSSSTPQLAPCWVSPPFLALQFCFSSMAEAGAGHGASHGGTCFLHSTWPDKRICITHSLCTGLKNLLLGKANPQAQSQDIIRNINFFFPHLVKETFQHLHPWRLHALNPVTSRSLIIGADQALFPREVSSPAAGQVLLSFSGFSPAFQQPSAKHRSEPSTQVAQGQAPQHSWCSATAPCHSQRWQRPSWPQHPGNVPSPFPVLCPSLAEGPGN